MVDFRIVTKLPILKRGKYIKDFKHCFEYSTMKKNRFVSNDCFIKIRSKLNSVFLGESRSKKRSGISRNEGRGIPRAIPTSEVLTLSQSATI